ncbi:hypothetical protein CK485_12445 [Streptomyces sp. ICBB 8177]|nr:hypothetical protein CK485_12445 [Streptomyces sp. ICBB 8177]
MWSRSRSSCSCGVLPRTPAGAHLHSRDHRAAVQRLRAPRPGPARLTAGEQPRLRQYVDDVERVRLVCWVTALKTVVVVASSRCSSRPLHSRSFCSWPYGTVATWWPRMQRNFSHEPVDTCCWPMVRAAGER